MLVTLVTSGKCKRKQHCWMLHVASVCLPCCMLLDVFAQSLKPVKFFSPVQTDATLLGVVASVCT